MPRMWHSFYCSNFSLHGIQEIFEQQISRASITEIKLEALLYLIKWFDSCGGLVMPHPRELFCMMVVWLLVYGGMYIFLCVYIALAT